ncbi:glycogen-debranching protein, partial [Candidatus Desantisbacteria bacterium]|nr:glycogen-debranching protein [Candidatus Desantisbacteria bacterium]
MPISNNPSKITFGVNYISKTKTLTFKIYSKNSTHIEICFFDQNRGADEIIRSAMVRENEEIWFSKIPLAVLQEKGMTNVIYYGFRAWGPNWGYDKNWEKGTETGFVCDVDEYGNRFNPNKLLLDPYAVEVSHDPGPGFSGIDPNEYSDDYYSGQGFRQIDTAKIAPKSMFIVNPKKVYVGVKPKRAIKDDVIYEVHLRGFTMSDKSIPENLRGTYKGAGLKALYLKNLGVTAVEFLPVQQFANEQNDDFDPRGDNYWGYMTLGYFAPNRRYSSDKSHGGPINEFKNMVKAFHSKGIKVIIDVVYNHTGEGLLKRATDDNSSREDDSKQFADRACILSFRGLDNANYYTLRSRPDIDNGKVNQRYQDNSACGASLNAANDIVRNFIIDSLKYWSDKMGVDGFRFDLAPVLGNAKFEGGYEFNRVDPKNVLNRVIKELPLRDKETLAGIDLIAEPWATGSGNTYQLGQFPDGWSEWNDKFRIAFRQTENKLHVISTEPFKAANFFSGSQQEFKNSSPRQDPKPYNSVNYIVSHDGFCMRDLFSYTGNENSWDHNGNPAKQRKAIRNAFCILMVSSGVPMFTGGDELFRTQNGLENTVAIDDSSAYINWENLNKYSEAIKLKDNDKIKTL